MSAAEPSRQFVDTNVLVYAFDKTAGEKRARARNLLAELWPARNGCLSLQVLAEFFASVTRKIPEPLPALEAARRVAHYARWNFHSPSQSDLLAAIDFHQELRISFWDAMIVQSARQLGCGILWTEDLSDGQSYAGVTVRNPFIDSVME